MSPRPKRNRRMGRPPYAKGFSPYGVSGAEGHAVSLFYEEYEAVRLCDYEGHSQADAARKMGVSRPTLTRIYEAARQKVAKALVESGNIVIGGGDVEFQDNWYSCKTCGVEFKKPLDEDVIVCVVCAGKEVNRFNPEDQANIALTKASSSRPKQGYCICPNCNKRTGHVAGIPCRMSVCEDCGVSLLREGSANHQRVLKLKEQKDK